MERTKTVAMIMAAGNGSRMKSKIKKQFIPVCGEPMILHSIRAFEENAKIDEIVIIAAKEDVGYIIELCRNAGIKKLTSITEGGSERFKSVYNGLSHLTMECKFLLIHDAARPVVSQELINRMCEAVQFFSACVPGVKIKDTVKVADDKLFCRYTPDRASLWSIQTPQAFSAGLLLRAYASLMKTIEVYHSDESKITDDAIIVENETNTKVRIVDGDYKNIKVTTPDDLPVAELFLKNRM